MSVTLKILMTARLGSSLNTPTANYTPPANMMAVVQSIRIMNRDPLLTAKFRAICFTIARDINSPLPGVKMAHYIAPDRMAIFPSDGIILKEAITLGSGDSVSITLLEPTTISSLQGLDIVMSGIERSI